MSGPLKVGIVGFGGAGMAQLGHFNAIDGCTVTAIYDPMPGGVARGKAASPSSLVTDDFAKLLASGIDIMAVCSSDKSHADYTVAAIDAGIHVVVEKPLADSIEGCRSVLQAEKRNPGVVAAVQHQMRFLPGHIEMKKIVQSGKLGRISYIEGYYVHNLTKRAYVHDLWRFRDNATPLVYSGCHFVDFLRWMLDDEVEEVMGMANNINFPDYPESDLNVILLKFRSGIIGKVVVAFGAGRPQDHSVRIYGSDMSIENNLLFSKDGSYEVYARPDYPYLPALPPGSYNPSPFGLKGRGYVWRTQRVIRHVRQSMPAYRTYALGKAMEWLMRKKGPDIEYGIGSYPLRLYPHNLAVRTSLENFVGAIRGTEPLLCTAKEAARTVATCLAGVEAYRTGKQVKVADYWFPELD